VHFAQIKLQFRKAVLWKKRKTVMVASQSVGHVRTVMIEMRRDNGAVRASFFLLFLLIAVLVWLGKGRFMEEEYHVQKN